MIDIIVQSLMNAVGYITESTCAERESRGDSMAGINLKFKDIERILIDNGFTRVRTKGDHVIYKRGTDTLSIPCPKCNGLILQRLFRQFNIKMRGDR